VRRVLEVNDDEGRHWSALVFGSHLLHELSEEEMMPLAMRGQAVSPVTSYLAIEPGVRPSTEGLDDSIGEAFGVGGIGLSGTGEGFGSSGGRLIDNAGFLRSALSKAWKSCGGSGPIQLSLETTIQEIVDVRLHAGTTKKASLAAERCLEEAAWAIDLPSSFRAELETFQINLAE
jgi:hypothetical protein